MELEVLGVRVGAPLGAACSSYAVSGASTVVLLDCGPGALERLWDRGLAERLDAIRDLPHAHGPRARPAPVLRRDHKPGESGAAVLDGLAGALGYDGSRFRESFHLREYGEGDAESLRQARELRRAGGAGGAGRRLPDAGVVPLGRRREQPRERVLASARHMPAVGPETARVSSRRCD